MPRTAIRHRPTTDPQRQVTRNDLIGVPLPGSRTCPAGLRVA